MSDVWFTRMVRRPQARVRLFCLSNAGVGGSVYRLWAAAMPETIEVQAVQLPGRESRFREPALRRIPAIVDGLCAALADRLDRPFAFFGHSMGAVLASEVARALHARGAAPPSHLFVSAYRPPHLPALHPPIHPLSDAEFLAAVQFLLYAGGVITVVVFAIVVTEKLVGEKISHTSKRLAGGAIVAAGIFGMLASVIQRAGLDTARPDMVGDATSAIGMSLLTKFVLPFELLGVLLLAGLIAASYFARPEE